MIITDLSAKEVAPVPPFATVTVSDNVEPAAVTVISPEPSKATPLIFIGVASAVAVLAFPEVSALLLGISLDTSPYGQLLIGGS